MNKYCCGCYCIRRDCPGGKEYLSFGRGSLAAGVAHASVTLHGKLWDVAAPAAIVLEAGGLVTTLDGRPIFPFDLRQYAGAKVPFLAAGPAAHPALLEEIRNNP